MKKRLLFLCHLFLLFSTANSWSDEFDNTPKLSVKGEASILKPADQMAVSLGVVTSAEKSDSALAQNRQQMQQVIANLNAIGLDASDYQTGRFQIRPLYAKPPKGAADDQQAVISGYEVSNVIEIQTQKIGLADKILDAAVRGGANQIEQVNFNLSNPQAYRAEVIQLATQNALADANALANAAGVKIVRVLDVTLDHWLHFPSPLVLAERKDISLGQTEELHQAMLTAGQTKIHATVKMVVEIKPH